VAWSWGGEEKHGELKKWVGYLINEKYSRPSPWFFLFFFFQINHCYVHSVQSTFNHDSRKNHLNACTLVSIKILSVNLWLCVKFELNQIINIRLFKSIII
jgi:hypothetical protein